MKKILLIATGGTIASEEKGEGLVPSMDVRQILSYVPELDLACQMDGITIMNVDSTNMTPARMAQMAEAVGEHYQQYDGFVITHGTDTMAYSSAALTYMLRNLGKPVVLTGSQMAMEAPDTDAGRNLFDAVCFACENIPGVFLVFYGRVISGTHAMKLKTRSKDAFVSINFPYIATISGGIVTYQRKPVFNGQKGIFSIAAKMEPSILVLKIFPGMGRELFDFIKKTYAGVIIESFGIGGVPADRESCDMAEWVSMLAKAGISVAVTTQCLCEGVDLNIYAVGKKLADENIILAGDMTTEALTMKLMWALGNCGTAEEVKKFVETPYLEDRSY